MNASCPASRGGAVDWGWRVSPDFSQFPAASRGSQALAASGLILTADGVYSHGPPSKSAPSLMPAAPCGQLLWSCLSPLRSGCHYLARAAPRGENCEKSGLDLEAEVLVGLLVVDDVGDGGLAEPGLHLLLKALQGAGECATADLAAFTGALGAVDVITAGDGDKAAVNEVDDLLKADFGG
jgi:hypothetical protein